MKIIVLEGSPNQRSSSNLLAGQFIRGAEEAGHTVSAVDIPRAGIHPCTGCAWNRSAKRFSLPTCSSS